MGKILRFDDVKDKSIFKGCLDCKSFYYSNYVYNDSRLLACMLEIIRKNAICPCSTCIVKTMCESQCKEFYDFAIKYGLEKVM